MSFASSRSSSFLLISTDNVPPLRVLWGSTWHMKMGTIATTPNNVFKKNKNKETKSERERREKKGGIEKNSLKWFTGKRKDENAAATRSVFFLFYFPSRRWLQTNLGLSFEILLHLFYLFFVSFPFIFHLCVSFAPEEFFALRVDLLRGRRWAHGHTGDRMNNGIFCLCVNDQLITHIICLGRGKQQQQHKNVNASFNNSHNVTLRDARFHIQRKTKQNKKIKNIIKSLLFSCVCDIHFLLFGFVASYSLLWQ